MVLFRHGCSSNLCACVTKAAEEQYQLKYESDLIALLEQDRRRRQALEVLRAIGGDEFWIGAGFVRNLVWDHLHGFHSTITGDVDILWFDSIAPVEKDLEVEEALGENAPEFDWEVKNQARMHLRNKDAPYTSVSDAMLNWTETATAVAAQIDEKDRISILAPFGLNDLFELRLRPGPACTERKREGFEKRVSTKGWLKKWPKLVCE